MGYLCITTVSMEDYTMKNSHNIICLKESAIPKMATTCHRIEATYVCHRIDATHMFRFPNIESCNSSHKG